MPIRILPSDLSSQISAGEVIERPASVVKEIIENSIDAGSKNINIFIEKSGFQSIILRDDGCGIEKKDLLLTVCHHATSKISALSDLEVLTTFGFRGEALASIRAVSRLTLISCAKFQKVASKIYLEGFSNKDFVMQPIAHPQGTTIIIENLFYNMPVRLKFLQNKKLEFLKICKVVQQISLSHFNINFSLQHNNKLILQYHSVNKNKKINRLKDIFNLFDINHFIEIEEKKDNMIFFGWILNPYVFKESKNIQYFYVNNRYVYNSVLINAVRSAYYKILGKTNISFFLYLKIAPNEIDINIHPTKNEIKFHQPDIIHTFIYEIILNNLKKIEKKFLLDNFSCKRKIEIHQKKQFTLDFLDHIFLTSTPLFLLKNNIFKKIDIKKKYSNLTLKNYLENYQCSIGELLIITRKYYGLIYKQDDFSLISFPLAKGIVRKQKLKDNIKKKIIPRQFSSHIKINVTSQEYFILLNHKEILLQIGFDLIFEKKYVILSSIPVFLKKRNLYLKILDFFAFLFLKKQILISEIINWLYINVFIELTNWTRVNGISVLLEIEYYSPSLLANPPPKLLQKININTALCILKI